MSSIRYKTVRGKKGALCDYHGTCMNKAFKEVYPKSFGSGTKHSGWSYLCRKHFKQELQRLRGKLRYCSVD